MISVAHVGGNLNDLRVKLGNDVGVAMKLFRALSVLAFVVPSIGFAADYQSA
jgi:hypothetical protein